MTPLDIPIRMFDSEIEHPSYSREGDAALDLRSTIDVELQPFERALIPCGFGLELPRGYCGFVVPRSGLAIHHGIGVANGPGLIDGNYRGEVSVVLINQDPHEAYSVHRGDRIAQLLIVAIPSLTLREAPALAPSERGAAGFGSSGRD